MPDRHARRLEADRQAFVKVVKNTDSPYYAELKGYVIMPRGKAGTRRTEITFDNKTEDTAKKIGDSLRVK